MGASKAAWRSAVRERRESAGLSGAALAARSGISRQALSRIESGAAIPSTLLALHLARTLRCQVEDLFSLPLPQVEAGGLTHLLPGTRVRLADVDGRWRALALSGEAGLRAPADGVVSGDGQGVVDVLGSLDEARRTALVAGCDPALGLLCSRVDSDARAAWVPAASLDALRAAARGEVHAAGLHLGSPERHQEWIARELPGARLFALWRAEQGLILASGNPHGVQRADDLRAAHLRLVTRAPGAGGRTLLDTWLAQAGLNAAQRGARHAGALLAASPLDAAACVARGEADVAPGPRAAAQAHGLPFIPLTTDAFDLAVPERHLAHPGVQALLHAARHAAFQDDLRSLGGYEPLTPTPLPAPPSPGRPPGAAQETP